MAKRASNRTAAPNKVPSASATAFAKILEEFGLNGPPPAPLQDIAFFLGAGFSKAWDAGYPTGPELFRTTSRERFQLTDVENAANYLGDPIADLSIDDVRQLVYAIDMNAQYTDIRSRYADDGSIRLAAEQLRTFFGMKLQRSVANWPWFDEELSKFRHPSLTRDQDKICTLFDRMFAQVDGSQGHLQGVRFNFITTNYDWLPELIVDRVCSADDSSLMYLYRGVTPDSVCGQHDHRTGFSHSLVFNLLKLNGGLEIFRRQNKYHFDYRRRTEDQYREDPPVLMLPSREQNYRDSYFLAVFPKATRLLQESKALVLVGYSLPEDDALLRFIIRHFCEDEADAHRKLLFYVDICPEREQLARLRSVFPFAAKTLKTFTYAGGFADWAAEVVSLV